MVYISSEISPEMLPKISSSHHKFFSCKMVCNGIPIEGQGLRRLCVQRVIWTPRTLFFDSLDTDTQKFMSEFAGSDFS